MVYKEGKIISQNGNKVIIEVDMGDEAHIIEKQKIKICEVGFADGRKISPRQRKYIYALIRDIGEATGVENEPLKELMKQSFCKATGEKIFSLANTDMTTATKFLDYLVEFCIQHEVETKVNLVKASSSGAKYIYSCCAKQKCCLYGGPAYIYDVDKMTRDIKPTSRVLPLSERGFKELMAIGIDDFETINFIQAIELDEYLYGKIMLEGDHKIE